MKEFDYEIAKKGRPVKTRDGRPARIISFDCKDVVRPIVALVETEPNREEVLMYSPSGKNDITEPGLDLVMRSEKHEGWVNVYKCGNQYELHKYPNLFKYKTDAEKAAEYEGGCVATVKIEWEE